MSTTIARSPELTAADRCDRCGAQAYVRVVMPSGADLLFCAHHWRDNSEALRTVAAMIHNELDRLADVSPTAAPDER